MSTISTASQRLAVIADVHGNEPALRAVLDDADRLGVDDVVVAGDLSGFGASPDLVTDILRQRGARMIRGNHEKDYVGVYLTPAMPAYWTTSRRTASLCWNMERLGAERRAFLSGLPDRLEVDAATLVVHGSPRHVRDNLRADTPVDEIEAMYDGESCRLAFSGHTHRPVVRETPRRRVVNVGSVGLPLDGDTRAAYALAERPPGAAPGEWTVEIRRVAYDVERAIAAHRTSGCLEAWPEYGEVYARCLRTGRDYLGPLLRATRDAPDEQFFAAARAFLDANP